MTQKQRQWKSDLKLKAYDGSKIEEKVAFVVSDIVGLIKINGENWFVIDFLKMDK